MTKSDISYASVPASDQAPYVQGFEVGDSHTATVIIDSHEPRNPYANSYEDANPFDGTRRPVTLSKCPHCKTANVRTSTKTYPTLGTWAGVVATGICFFPLFWVPLVLDTCKQTDHYCQTCHRKLATVKPLEGCCVKEMQ